MKNEKGRIKRWAWAVGLLLLVMALKGAWEALSAIGTIAAAVAAVWLGYREIDARDDSEAREHNIVATIVNVELHGTLMALETVLPVLRDLAASQSGGQITLSSVTRVALAAGHISVASIDKVLDKLGYLNGGMGPRVAAIWSVVPAISAEVSGLGETILASNEPSYTAQFGARHSLMARSALSNVEFCIENIRSVLVDLQPHPPR